MEAISEEWILRALLGQLGATNNREMTKRQQSPPTSDPPGTRSSGRKRDRRGVLRLLGLATLSVVPLSVCSSVSPSGVVGRGAGSPMHETISGPAQTKRRFLKPIAIGIAALLVVGGLLIAGWLLWTVLRPPPSGFAPTGGQTVAVPGLPPGVLQHTIDARSRQNWVHFNFSRGTPVSTSRERLDWDIAFRRTDILTNGGETNPEGLAAAIDLGETPLEQAALPTDGYLADASDDERGLENPALHKWYSYSWTTHIISTKSHTYAVRTATGEAVLLTLVSYYCDDGSSGCVTIQYILVDEP